MTGDLRAVRDATVGPADDVGMAAGARGRANRSGLVDTRHGIAAAQRAPTDLSECCELERPVEAFSLRCRPVTNRSTV